MKTIYGALDPNNFFKLEIDDECLETIKSANKWITDCPYDGFLWINTSIYHINLGALLPCKIEITKEHTNVVVTTYQDDYLLEWGDDLLKLPEVHLTRRFQIMREDAKKHLSERDKQFITSWEVSR